MESLEEESIIKDGRKVFILEELQKETNDAAIKDMKKLFKLEKKIKQVNM